MSLNIKNEITCQLICELAQLTNETKTAAITIAVRERLERENRRRDFKTRLRETTAIAERCAKLMASSPPIDHGDFLYDEHGMPK